MSATIDEIRESLKRGKAKRIEELIRFAIQEGVEPRKIMEEGLLHGMEQVSARFKEEEVEIAEILSIMRALNSGMDILKKLAIEQLDKKCPTVILGTVKGDFHDIGKKMIEMMLVGQGINVIDLGVDVPAYKFIDSAVSKQAQIVCCSGFLENSKQDMKKIVDEFRRRGIRKQFYIMIGGPFVNEEIAEKIGADCYTEDASACVKKIREYCKKIEQTREDSHIYRR